MSISDCGFHDPTLGCEEYDYNQGDGYQPLPTSSDLRGAAGVQAGVRQGQGGKFLGYVPYRANRSIVPPALPQPVPFSSAALELLGTMFKGVLAQNPQSKLKNPNGDQVFPHVVEHRFSKAAESSVEAGSSADPSQVAVRQLLESAQSRQGLVQLKTREEVSLFEVFTNVLMHANGKGVKLDEKLSIRFIKVAATYVSQENKMIRRRAIIQVYDADLQSTFEMPLTEICMSEATPEAFNDKLPEIKSAMDAHLYAIHPSYRDSVTQPNVVSLKVPQWANLLAAFEDAQIRIQSKVAYSINEIQDSVHALCEQTPQSSVLLDQMLRGILTPDLDGNAIAKLRPELLQNGGAWSGPDNPDEFRRSRHHDSRD